MDASTSVVRTAVRRNAYADSVTLLQVTSSVAAVAGVLDAALVMGTDLNRDVLRESGLLVGDALATGPNDLIVAVRATDASVADAGLAQAEALLTERRRAPEGQAAPAAPRSLRSAHRHLPDANLALISVPGPYAAGEARQALADGLHVFLFSDNVPLADEIELKRRGRDLGLLVMGPDCGTALLNGAGLGFTNAVRRGRVGLVGASGTGLQEVMSLLHRAGEGISHAVGTGGRDLDERVGALTTLQALELLAEDPDTEVIVLVSKAPGPAVAEQVLNAASETGKPVVACLLGAQLAPPRGVQLAGNLYQAARLAASAAARWDWEPIAPEDVARPRLRAGQDTVCGLFCGGTLLQEAELSLGDVRHELVDFGDDRYTRGRAHPMIDPTLRNQAILAAAADPSVAVLLLDVILGYAAHPDPAGAAAPVVRQAIARSAADGRQLTVLGHVVGTDGDVQSLERQEATLRAAGVHLFGSSYHAAVAASLLLQGVEA